MVDYQTVHPATKLWWAQRETCQRCQHLQDLRPDGGGMRCQAIAHVVPTWPVPFCIDARGPGRSCGPDARLFKERA